MANYTTNYNLKKPLGNENYNVEDQNGNMDIIEQNMSEVDSHLAEIPNQTYITDKAKQTDVPQQTLANITYYVATTGNDTTGDGTSGLPFKTIQYAIDKLPQIVNHVVTINVSAGTYPESLIISGLFGKGDFTISGATSTSTTHNISDMNILNCSLKVKIIGFNITTTTVHSISITNCINTWIQNMNLISVNTSKNGVSVTNSFCLLGSNTISNKSNAIFANLARVKSGGVDGTNNAIGLMATNSATIGKGGPQPSGTTSEVVSFGGVIR